MTAIDKHIRTDKPFGEILTSARASLKLSRAEVARRTGITENSLSRYERVGIDESGQYPPAQKLASLCAILGISTSDALSACLPEEFSEIKDRLSIGDEIANDPATIFMTDQYFQLLQDVDILRAALKHVVEAQLAPDDSDYMHSKEFLESILVSAEKVNFRHEEFEQRMIAHGSHRPLGKNFTYPGNVVENRWAFDLRCTGIDPFTEEFQKRVGEVWNELRERKIADRLKPVSKPPVETEKGKERGGIQTKPRSSLSDGD